MRISDWSSDVCSSVLRVAVLQLAALAIGEFDDDAVPIDLFYAGDRRVDHPASIALVAIGPADALAFVNLDTFFVAELQPIKLAVRVDLGRFDTVLASAHIAELDEAVFEDAQIGRANV